jgi:hypothetical protein
MAASRSDNGTSIAATCLTGVLDWGFHERPSRESEGDAA